MFKVWIQGCSQFHNLHWLGPPRIRFQPSTYNAAPATVSGLHMFAFDPPQNSAPAMVVGGCVGLCLFAFGFVTKRRAGYGFRCCVGLRLPVFGFDPPRNGVRVMQWRACHGFRTARLVWTSSGLHETLPGHVSDDSAFGSTRILWSSRSVSMPFLHIRFWLLPL